MPFVSKDNIEQTTSDVRPPILNRRKNAAFASSFAKRRVKQIPVRDISPPASIGSIVSLRSQSGKEKDHRGVPLATFVSSMRQKLKRSPATFAVVEEPDGVIVEQRTITAEEARVIRQRRQTPSLRWSVVVLTIVFSLVSVSLVGSVYWVGKGILVRVNDIESGTEAIVDLVKGEEALKVADYERAADAFRRAYVRLDRAEDAVGFVGRSASRLLALFSGGNSSFSSSERLLSAASSLSKAGEHISRALAIIRPSDVAVTDSFTDRLLLAGSDLNAANVALQSVRGALNDIEPTSLNGSLITTFSLLESRIPPLQELLDRFLVDRSHILGLLGHDSPVSYLLLFQNNAEIRATGGFIGTVALLELDQGSVRRFESMNVFDIDGQLIQKVVPPRPIQKISTAWSLHDSNWFFDFPTSARNAAWFYEQSGGPTVDGVIAITPDLLVRFLELLGPVELPEYGVTLTSDNVLVRLQQQVEQGYTQSLNRPKRIVGDLVSVLQTKLQSANTSVRASVGVAILESLVDRTIMLWLRDPADQNWVNKQGWDGAVYKTTGDYLAVVRSNINGFKTDAVIEETVEHSARIEVDGRVVDTVTVTRRHTGGNTGIDWWDKVNADYLRVYVPEGSRLISAEGHTRERVEEVFDYQENGFSSNTDVADVERTFRIDKQSGTHIFEEGDKTVFANWVYVSPGRTVSVRYVYELPFRVYSSQGYTMTVQHQPGVLEGVFSGSISIDSSLNSVWASDTLNVLDGGWNVGGIIGEDRVYGVVLE